MATLPELLIKYKFQKPLQSPKVNFDEIENAIGFLLPEDYKYFLENCFEEEMFIGPEYLCLWAFDDLLNTNQQYLILDNLKNTIGIGSNRSSECIAIVFFDEDNYRVVLTPFIDLDEQSHIEIGTSFTDMLERLDNGKEWFN